MTFSAGIPVNAQSPGQFPAQCRTNWLRLKEIINAEHVFNDTQAQNDGVHRRVTLIDQANPTNPLPTGTNSELRSKLVGSASQLYFWNGTTDYAITPNTIFAAVNFDGTVAGNNAAQTIRTSFNVTSVTRIGTSVGGYKITFTTPSIDTNYLVECTGMRLNTNNASVGCVQGAAAYGTSVTVGYVLVQFFGSTSTFEDTLMGNVIITRLS